MRKQSRENDDTLNDHSLDITGLNVKWFEVNPKEMKTHKKTKREQVKTYQTKRKQLSPISFKRQFSATLKPSLKLQPNGLQQHSQSSFCSKLLPAMTTCLNETQKCYFCGQQQSNGMVGSLIMKQTQHVGIIQNIFIHENCLLWSSRYLNETDDQLILRVKMHSMSCSFCGYKRASIGCYIKDCRYVSHYLCAIASNGDWIDNQGFLCPFHIKLTKLANFKKMEWPISSFSSQFHYIYNNSWTSIHQKELDMIAKYSTLWESYSPCWHKQNLETKTQIVEIQSGHWAWSNELSRINLKQFELKALINIKPLEVIGEYVGQVKYQKQCKSGHYMASFWYPEKLKSKCQLPALCIDAEYIGNEMRFINSISPTTPFFIKQNATMTTLWCNNKLRIFIVATRHIEKGFSIVLNYNEYGDSYFEEKDETYSDVTLFNQCFVSIPRIHQNNNLEF